MVVDTLENLEKYASLNPLFAQAIDFLKSHDLQAMEIGKTELKGKDLFVNIAQTKPKTKEEDKLELITNLLIFKSRCREQKLWGILLLKIVFRQMHLITQKKTLLFLKDWQKHTLP